MQNLFDTFTDHKKCNQIMFTNKNFISFFNTINIHLITSDNQISENDFQVKNIKYNIITIDKYQYIDINYFIIYFDNKLFLIDEENVAALKPFFLLNKDLHIYILKSSINFINKLELPKRNCSSFHFSYSDDKFNEEIRYFSKEFQIVKNSKQIIDFWKSIVNPIAAFLIKMGYQNSRINRTINYEQYFDKNNEQIEISKNDYIVLKDLARGSASSIKLIYHIEKQKLYILKIFNSDSETPKLFQREYNNYSKIHHPLLLKCFGSLKSERTLILEYVEGCTLEQISQMKLTMNEKMKIAFQILIIIEFIHKNHYIYRDLKPNNIIIDTNNTVVLIDLDRMVKNEPENIEANYTVLTHNYLSPEISCNAPFSYSTDIYSIGMMIIYIICEKNPQEVDIENFPKEYSKLGEIIKRCIQTSPDKRPKISELVDYFYTEILPNISNNIVQINKNELIQNMHNEQYFQFWFFISEFNNPFSQGKLGVFFEDESINPDSKKAMHYYSLAANKNDNTALNNLGCIYYEGLYVPFDIQKAIHYFTLAANQNNPAAQYNLAEIYYSGKYVEKDINKAMNYLFKSANQNYDSALCKLGAIYQEGIYVKKNIDKAIQYFTLGAKHNHLLSVKYLANIYKEKGLYYHPKEAIEYLTLLANLNDASAQYNLGLIYETEYAVMDISKAISYYMKASDQNHPIAQNNLGCIYMKGEYVKRNVQKAFEYFELASRNKNQMACLNLGEMYLKGEYVMQNVNKSNEYFLKAPSIGKAQCHLGYLYFTGNLISQDFEKAFYYFSVSANLNCSRAQFFLGLIYLDTRFGHFNINMAINYFKLAANNKDWDAKYILGTIYLNNHYTQQDISKAITYYKEASSLNNPFAKNNLAIIYSNEMLNNLNIPYAIELLEESIKINQSRYNLSNYNLAHVLIYHAYNENNLERSISLLLNSLYPYRSSLNLLVIALLIKHKEVNTHIIKREIELHITKDQQASSDKIAHEIYQIITKNKTKFELFKKTCRGLEYVYEINYTSSTKFFLLEKKEEQKKKERINEMFYEGLGLNIS